MRRRIVVDETPSSQAACDTVSQSLGFDPGVGSGAASASSRRALLRRANMTVSLLPLLPERIVGAR